MPKKWSDLPKHADRAPQSSGLRAAILGTVAENNLLAVREKMHAHGYGLNDDDGNWIKRFFIEGLGWTASQWEGGKSGDASEDGAKSMWCAAFASYCYVQGHAKEGAPLFLKRDGNAGRLRDNLIKAGLFIPMSSLYDGAKKPIKPAPRLPGPGDFIVFPGHIGLLKSFNHDARTLEAIEGNTYVDPKHRADGVYEIHVKDPRFGTIEGFGICDPVPCTSNRCGWEEMAH